MTLPSSSLTVNDDFRVTLETATGTGEIITEDNFYSYMYLSLITQTTVGFGGVLPDGGHFLTTKSIFLRYLVFLQLLSVIIMTGWTLA